MIRQIQPARKSLKSLLAAILLSGSWLAALPAHAQSSLAAPVAVTQSGVVQGVHDGDVDSFKGVPFAEPPVGDLRWQAPRALKPWSGRREAKAFAPDCAQTPEPNTRIAPRAAQSEDCLYLNIWKPAGNKGPLPVLVWIYGGGFTNGGTTPVVYDGANLARQGVILVSINYRVGQLGFFAHPALAKEQAGQPRGNYGFLDQIAAMQWIRRNIAAFGGDPKNITAFGESAGGFSVHMLLTSPLAKGLIDKAIIESGGGRRTIMNGQRMSEEGPRHHMSAEDKGLGWARSHGIEGDGPEALAKLRALTTAQVLEGMGFMNPNYAGPMIDGTIVPYNMMTAYDSARYAHIPLIIGTNSGDMNLNFSKTKDQLFAAFGNQEARARAIYDPDGTADLRTVASKEGADEMMHETARYTAQQFAQGGTSVYLYRFGYMPAVNRPGAEASTLKDSVDYGGLTGAYHTTEIPFVFDTVAARYDGKATTQDLAMGKIMSGYWVAFAKSGDPNGASRPAWTPYAPAAGQLLIIENDGAAMKSDPWKARLDVAETLNLKTAE